MTISNEILDSMHKKYADAQAMRIGRERIEWMMKPWWKRLMITVCRVIGLCA